MEELTNEPGAVVDEMLDGMVVTHPELRRLDGTNVLVRDDAPVEGKIAVVSGGGLDREPAHTGYLGEGMPDGVTAGEVFTSSTADQLNEMVQATGVGEGVFCVVKNYKGNVMSFDTAAKMVGMEGVDVEQAAANDGVAIEDSLYTSGRHGVAGTIFVHKYVGARATMSGDLDGITAVTGKVVNNARTTGMALISCVTPEEGESTFDLGEDEVELGAGTHGEPNIERTDVVSADEITGHLAENILDDLDLDEGEEVMTMVSGTGGTLLSELYIVNHKLQPTLDDRGIETWGAWVGDYMTSLDMMGCSVFVLYVDDELRELLGMPAGIPGLTVTE